MATQPRSFWKGYLRLALVTVPIRLVSATESEKPTSLHQIDRRTNQRIRYQKVSAGDGRIVPNEDIVKGAEVEPGRYVLIDDDDIEALKLSTRHTVELSSFVKLPAIDPVYFEKPYYVLPDGEIAEEGYRVLRDALYSTGMCGIGQLAMRGREHLVALSATEDGLVLTTLRYASELRDAHKIFAGIGEGELKRDMVAMAKQLIAERTSDFEPAEFHDHYAEALAEIIAVKSRGGGAVDVAGGEEARPSGTVIDFMEALRRSVELAELGDKAATGAARKNAASAKREPVRKSVSNGRTKATKSRAKPATK